METPEAHDATELPKVEPQNEPEVKEEKEEPQGDVEDNHESPALQQEQETSKGAPEVEEDKLTDEPAPVDAEQPPGDDQEPQAQPASLELDVPKKPRTGGVPRKPGNAWKQMEGLVTENGAPQERDSRLETDAEQEIAAALFDLANAANQQQEEDDEDDYMQPQVRVPKGHTIHDLNLHSRKRPRKPNRNYAMFEDPGDDDDEDWDAEDEYLHNRLANRPKARGSGRGANKTTRHDTGPSGGYGGRGGMQGYEMPQGYDPRMGGPPQYFPPGVPPHYQQHHQQAYPPQMMQGGPPPPMPPQMARPAAPPPRFKRGANHIAIAHFIQWHKQDSGGSYAAPPPAQGPQGHPGMMGGGQLSGHPDVAAALSNAIRNQHPGLGPLLQNLPPALLAQLRQGGAQRPPGAPGMAGMPHGFNMQQQHGAPPQARPDMDQMMKANQLKQINDLLMASQQRQKAAGGGDAPGGLPPNALAQLQKMLQGGNLQLPGQGGAQPRPPPPQQPQQPGQPPLSQDAMHALRALQSALPFLTNAANVNQQQGGAANPAAAPAQGAAVAQLGPDAMKSLQATLQNAISKIPGGAGGALSQLAAAPVQPPMGSALAGALAAVLRQQQQQQGGAAAQHKAQSPQAGGEQQPAVEGAGATEAAAADCAEAQPQDRSTAEDGVKKEEPDAPTEEGAADNKEGSAPAEGGANGNANATTEDGAPATGAEQPPADQQQQQASAQAPALQSLLTAMANGGGGAPNPAALATAIAALKSQLAQGGGDPSAAGLNMDSVQSLLAKVASSMPMLQSNLGRAGGGGPLSQLLPQPQQQQQPPASPPPPGNDSGSPPQQQQQAAPNPPAAAAEARTSPF